MFLFWNETILGRNGGKNTKETTCGGPSKSEHGEKGGGQNILDPNHWSKQEKFDAEVYLEGPYKKHLGRHANKWVVWNRNL